METTSGKAASESTTSTPMTPLPPSRECFLGIRRTMLVPLVVACAMFMEMVDATVISTALPLIARDFGKDPLVLKLGLSAYLVSLAVFIPISGLPWPAAWR